ncbi:hypothetical protein B5G28_13795, partial [Faecalibacterium sp. An77]
SRQRLAWLRSRFARPVFNSLVLPLAGLFFVLSAQYGAVQLLIGAVVLIGGGAGYYFKICKPKHEAPDLEDDYCEYEDEGPEEIAEEPEDEDTPPWDEDTEEQEARQ